MNQFYARCDSCGYHTPYHKAGLKCAISKCAGTFQPAECPKGTHESLDDALGCEGCQCASRAAQVVRAFQAANKYPPKTFNIPPLETGPVAALPDTVDLRKGIPLATGVLDYFPAALAEVARCSKQGNDQHNPGQPLHWARGKSMDHADCLMRHLADRGVIDKDGISHTAKVAWRALALLQEELEAKGAPKARAAR